MKRFLLFAGPCFYPHGGWDDFRGDFDSMAVALEHYAAFAKGAEGDEVWGHVMDLRECKKIDLPNCKVYVQMAA